MWAVAAQPRTGLTPMMPTPSGDSGIARADLTSKLLPWAVDDSAPYHGSLPGGDRCDCLVDEHEPVHERVRGLPVRRGSEDVGLIIGRIRACSTRTISAPQFRFGWSWWIPPSACARSRGPRQQRRR